MESYGDEDVAWDRMEVKVRRLIKEVLQPSLVRLKSAEMKSGMIVEAQRKIKSKLKYFKSQLGSLEIKIPKPDEFRKEIVESHVRINVVEIEAKRDNEILNDNLNTLMSKIDHTKEQFSAVFAQIDQVRAEVKNSRQDFVLMKNSIEDDLYRNIHDFEIKSQKCLESCANVMERYSRFNKKVQTIADSLCEVEVLAKSNQIKIIEGWERFEKKTEEAAKETGRLEAGLKGMRYDYGQGMIKVREEIERKVKEMNDKIESGLKENAEKQDRLVYDWMKLVFVEPRYKQRILEVGKAMGLDQENEKADKEDSEHVLATDEGKKVITHQQKQNNENVERELGRVKNPNSKSCEISLKKLRKPSDDTTSRSYNHFSNRLKTKKKLPQKLNKTSKSYDSFPVIRSTKASLMRVSASVSVPSSMTQLALKSSCLSLTRPVFSFPATPKIEKIPSIKPQESFKSLQIEPESACEIIPSESPKTLTLAQSVNPSLFNFIPDTNILPPSPNFIDSEPVHFNQSKPSKHPEISLILEDLQFQIDSLKHEQHSLYTQQIKSESKTEDLIESLTCTIETCKDQQMTYSAEQSEYIEHTLKPWMLLNISNTLQSAFASIDSTSTDLSMKLTAVNNSHRELEMLINQTTKEFNLYISNKRRELCDIQSDLKSANKSLWKHKEYIASIRSDVEKLDKSIDDVRKTVLISNVLFKQDEIDRKTISLLASKKDQKKSKIAKSPVSLDKNCLSCSNNFPQVMPAFKIACLAYNSSPILYNNRNFTRTELLELQESLLTPEMPPQILLANESVLNKRSLTPELPKIKISLR